MGNRKILKSYLYGWEKCFDYEGKTTRREFWLFVFITLGVVFLSYSLIAFFAMVIFPGGGDINTFVFILVVFRFYSYLLLAVLLLPMLSIGVRRMHDIGISGWWFVCSVIFYFFGLSAFVERLIDLISIYSDKSYSYDIKMTIYLTSNIFVLLLISLLCCQPANSK